MEFQAVSGPKFTGHFPLNAGGIAIVCNAGRFQISLAVPEIFAVKVGVCARLPWSIARAYKNFTAQHPLRAEI